MKRLLTTTTALSVALSTFSPLPALAQTEMIVEGQTVWCLPNKAVECPEGAFCVVAKNPDNCERNALKALAAVAEAIEPYRYNIQALRKSVVAGLPVDTFHWLLDHSIGFNRFVMNQLNERLGQFIAAREIDRMTNPDVRVARSLAALFNPVLYPGVGEILRITQQELAYLVGLSRQRVNEALANLQAQGTIRIEYGGLRVLDLAALGASFHIQKRPLAQ